MMCRLCKANEADKTGSHIISFFLIRSTFNDIGVRQRDKEKVFRMNAGTFVDSYFGRSVKPEDVFAVKGRLMTEEEIDNNKNPFVVDNILCTHCEKRISALEGYVAQNFYTMLESKTYTDTKDSKFFRIADLPTCDFNLVRLFLCSLLWRSSIVKFQKFKLSLNEEETLRAFLDENLDLTTEVMIKKCSQIPQLPILIIYATTPEDKKDSNPVYLGLPKRPYFTMINNLIFFTYFKRRELRSLLRPFLGIAKMMDVPTLAEAQINTTQCLILKEEAWSQVKVNLTNTLVEQTIHTVKRKFIEIHKNALGFNPPDNLLKRVLRDYTSGDPNLPQSEQYSNSRLRDIFLKYLKESARII